MKINNDNYVDKAEKAIKSLNNVLENNKRDGRLTTSKLRNLLAMTADIYNQVSNSQRSQLDEKICERIEYLRVRFIYEAGRDGAVKHFLEEAELLDILKEIRGQKENYILFSHYMEALTAFHRFYGGKDN